MNRLSPPMLAAFAGVIAVAGCADAPPAATAAAVGGPESDCFHANSVNGFSPVNDELVDVRVGANRHYRLELAGYCPDVDWSWRIGLRTRGGSSWICHGLDAELVVPSPTGRQTCLVSDVRRLSAAEVEARR